MATVLTRLLPASPSRFIGRNAGKQTELANASAVLENSQTQLEKIEDATATDDTAIEMNGEAEETEEGLDEAQADNYASSEDASKDSDGDLESSTLRKRKKRHNRVIKSRKRRKVIENDEDDEEESDVEDVGNSSSNDATSTEQEWEAEDGEEEQDEAEAAEGTRCTYVQESYQYAGRIVGVADGSVKQVLQTA